MGGQPVHVGHEVVEIDLARRRILCGNGLSAHFEVLVSSLPLPELVRLIREAPPAVREAASRLTCTSLVLVNVGIERAEGFPSHWMYFYDEDVIFARGSFPHRLSPGNAPPGCGSIQVEIYHSRYRPLPCADVLTRAVEDLHRVGLLRSNDRIRIAYAQRVPYANVLFDLERPRNLGIVQQYLRDERIITCGRYGEWAYFWSDDAIISGWRAADDVVRALRAS
jgi:protoporphyrinogen oxidase